MDSCTQTSKESRKKREKMERKKGTEGRRRGGKIHSSTLMRHHRAQMEEEGEERIK
jgi:hypothetical protein